MKIQEAILGWAYSAFCMISHTEAFSHGASLVACVDMKPRHIRAQLQNPRNSYITIYTNVSSYSPGDKVPVTVKSRGDFMGFLLQARRVSDDQIAGTFVSIPSRSKLMSCFEGANTVTHLDKSPKRNLSFVWKAPQQPTGDIKFFLSVVQSYFIYWERIESTIVSQQTQNRTLSDGNVEPAASLRKPNGLEVTTTVPSITPAQHTQPVAFAVVSLAGTSVTDSLEPALVTTETPGDEEHLLNPSPLGDMTAGASGSDQGGQPDRDGPHPGRGQTSEPSPAVPGLENFPFQDDGSRHNPPNRTGGASAGGPAPPCLRCEEREQERPEASRPPRAGPPGAPPAARLSSSRPGGAPPDSRGLPEAQAEAQGGPGPRSARRGLLLGLSAALGVALAAGLRRLRARPCRRRGARGSLPEPAERAGERHCACRASGSTASGQSGRAQLDRPPRGPEPASPGGLPWARGASSSGPAPQAPRIGAGSRAAP